MFWTEMDEPIPVAKIRLQAPKGHQTCKIDAAGRLKLPAKYQEYLKDLADKYLFLTVHKGMARIFTNGSWERTVAKIEDKALRKRFTFRAEARGGDVELDPQGRVTLPQGLRKDLNLEDTTVQLRFYEDVITIYSQEQYDAEFGNVNNFEAADTERLDSLEIDF